MAAAVEVRVRESNARDAAVVHVALGPALGRLSPFFSKLDLSGEQAIDLTCTHITADTLSVVKEYCAMYSSAPPPEIDAALFVPVQMPSMMIKSKGSDGEETEVLPPFMSDADIMFVTGIAEKLIVHDPKTDTYNTTKLLDVIAAVSTLGMHHLLHILLTRLMCNVLTHIERDNNWIYAYLQYDPAAFRHDRTAAAAASGSGGEEDGAAAASGSGGEEDGAAAASGSGGEEDGAAGGGGRLPALDYE